MHFSLPKNKSEQRNISLPPPAPSYLFLSFRCSHPPHSPRGLFIDIIMGNFRQHGKIYFTSCSSWSNFEWASAKKKCAEERKKSFRQFTGRGETGKLFFNRYRCCLGEFFGGEWKCPPVFLTLLLHFPSIAGCHHQFGCIREEIEKFNCGIFQPPNHPNSRAVLGVRVEGKHREAIKNLKTLEKFNFTHLNESDWRVVEAGEL